MAEDCTDGDYLGAYSRFFSEFVARVNPYDQLPVSVSSCNVTEAEIVGEIINVTLQYLNQTQCPSSLQAHLVHQVIQEIKSMCKKQPEDCGFKTHERIYTSLKLMQAITGKVNEICTRYLDNSILALLPPPSTPFPQIIAGGSKNCRRKMEDRYVVLHDLHTTFGIQGDSIANYYAVFDGHAGQDAAVYCATHLHQYLAESIYYPTDPERALRDAFITTDTQIVEKSKTQKVNGGTTAVCTLILNKKMYVAWVGDSTATLIKRDSIVQLVNPHRLHRDDEVQRIQKMGGVVLRSMDIMRVNGILGVSRAIGDVQYKPYVTGEPEIKSVLLDGTEDFLVLATDGLTDYLEPADILTILYYEIQRDPNGFKRAHQILLQWAKHAGSTDNITVVVVLLTPASEIAARPRYAHPYHSLQVNDILEKMNSKEKPLYLDIDDARNAINSSILKQTMISQEPRSHNDDGILAASNGKHENGDADYDYSDLGPETDVDAIDDVPTMPVRNLSYEFFKDDTNHDEQQTNKDSNILRDMDVDETTNDNATYKPISDNNVHEDDDDDEDEDEDDDDEDDELENRDAPGNIMAPELVHVEVPENIHEVRGAFGKIMGDEMDVKLEDETDDASDAVDKAGPVDYDDLPASPQANKPLQHALIHEADNVADSEDSEDEWNYYRVDPNKEKDTATPVDKPEELRNEENIKIPEDPVEDAESKIQSDDIEQEVKSENPKEESPELINTEISAKSRAAELEEEEERQACEEEQDKLSDMDFQLNPNAAEFVPGSPQLVGTRMNNLVDDYPLSGSPFKQVQPMDDIQVPTQSEFDKEVCQRPREVDAEEKEYQNGEDLQRSDYTDFISERQKVSAMGGNLDDSEISSTKAEFGDESTASFLTTSELHGTGMCMIDESFSSSERDYDIAKDPMAMSFTPSDFQAAFEKGVDLNAVHNLSNTDLDEQSDSIEKEQDLVRRSPGLESDSTDLMTAPEAKEPVDKLEFPEESAVLVNLSSQQEDSEDTFIDHADELKLSADDSLNLRPESPETEQQEAARYDHSPLTDNYSAEFESEKEVISVNNEQYLSPSSADIDETKPIDEASEEAALPENDFQQEPCPMEADTPTSLSPVPDAMESEFMAPAKSTEAESSEQTQLLLHTDCPKFMPGQYSFPFFGAEDDKVCRSSSAEGADACPASPTETNAARQLFATKPDEEFETAKLVENKVVEEPACKMEAPVQDNLLDFAEELDICTRPSAIQGELTPPLSPQQVEQKFLQTVDDLVCPLKPSVTSEETVAGEIESEKAPEVTSVVENKEEEIMKAMEETIKAIEPAQEIAQPVEPVESVKEPTLNLSESMQEFTGLEKQLQPKEEEVPEPIAVAVVREEIKLEEIKETAGESEILLKTAVDEAAESKAEKNKEEVQEIPAEAKKPEIVELEAKEPMMKDAELREPEAKELDLKEPEAKELDLKEPEAKELDLKEPEIKDLDVKEPEGIKDLDVKESEEIKDLHVKEPEEIKVLDVKQSESKEPKPETLSETSEKKSVAAFAVAAAAATVAVTAGAAAAHSKTKGKPAAAKSTKTAASKAAPTKSTPTSPSKTITSATKTSLTAAKKPLGAAPARPKDLDAPRKSTVSNTTTNKQLTPKSTAKTTTSTAATKTASKTTTGVAPKLKPTTLATSKSTAADKKPTANGDVKPLSKPTAAKPPSKTAPVTKTTLEKTSTTRATTGSTTAAKPRRASATMATRSSLTTKSTTSTTSSTVTATARPKTAPATGNATKPRTLTAKSPMIDKQVKETANKQISMARTSTTAPKTTRLSSTTNSTTTAAKRLSAATKNTTTASPTKKLTPGSRISGKSSVGGKTGDKGKIVQNGVSGKVEINALIDDVPKKDLSPVVAPNDNQLIMSSD